MEADAFAEFGLEEGLGTKTFGTFKFEIGAGTGTFNFFGTFGRLTGVRSGSKRSIRRKYI